MRDDLTIVVSPLVALMQDQVEALAARGLGERVALVNAQQGADANSGVLRSAAAGELPLLYVAPERFASPGSSRGFGGPRWAVRGRRGSLRLAVGARLPARLLPPGRRRAPPGCEGHRGLHRHGHAAGGRGYRAPPGPARPGAGGHGLRPAQPLVRGGAPGAAREAPADRRGARRPDALPAIVYAGTRAGVGGDRGAAQREFGEEAMAYHAGLDRERRADVQRRFLADEVAGDRGHQRLRHGRGQAQRAHGAARQRARPRWRPTTRRPAARAATGSRPGRCCSRRTATRHCTSTSSSARRSTPAARWLADRLSAACRRRRPIPDSTRASWPESPGGGPDRLRALMGHLSRAGVISPMPPRPTRSPAVSARPGSTPRGRRCRVLRGGGRQARWRQYREIWAYIEADTAAAAETILRHFGDRPARSRGGRAVLRHLRRRASCPRRLLPSHGGGGRPGRRDHLGGPGGRARGGADHLRGDPARRADQEDPAQLLRRAACLWDLLAHAPGRTSWRASTS